MQKQFIINLQHNIDHFDLKNVLHEILNKFNTREIKFAGYLNGQKVASIDKALLWSRTGIRKKEGKLIFQLLSKE